MRNILVLKEQSSPDGRIPLVPESVRKLKELGSKVLIEAGLGAPLGFEDSEFEDFGAIIVNQRAEAFSEADIVLGFNPPKLEDLDQYQSKQIHIGFLNPFGNSDLIDKFCERNVTSIAMDFIPRSTIAQKMDAISSQANLAGYSAVITASHHLEKALPMMMTPSGTIQPARVFVIGVGVAGLQAIATAKRLGARVDAFDPRPAVEEQVRSLGAKFLKIDLGETSETRDGYAKAMTAQQLELQREAMARQCEFSDVVITAAQVFGKKAPVIVTKAMIEAMSPGSVIVDTAIETGGNVEISKPGEIIEYNGVKIIGYSGLAGKVAKDASRMYSNNLVNFISHFWNQDSKGIDLDFNDEIIQNSMLTHDQKVFSHRLNFH